MSDGDVRAICDAGNSSKRGDGGRARIGRKGVGFKSTFKLSMSPHVLSAAHAFRFDLAANGLRMEAEAPTPSWPHPIPLASAHPLASSHPSGHISIPPLSPQPTPLTSSHPSRLITLLWPTSPAFEPLHCTVGYVLPEPLSKAHLGALPAAVTSSWRADQCTVFYLPLRPDAPRAAQLMAAVRARGTALLFLRRLRAIGCVDEDSGRSMRIRRVVLDSGARRRVNGALPSSWGEEAASVGLAASADASETGSLPSPLVSSPPPTTPLSPPLPAGVVEWAVSVEALVPDVAGGGDTGINGGHQGHEGPRGSPDKTGQRFLRCEATIEVPPSLQRRAGGATTRVALALPLAPPLTPTVPTYRGSGEEDGSPPSNWGCCSVHCFLPVRDVGLRFALHADFNLTSSRDDVHNDEWNRYLRDATPSLFVAAVAAQHTGAGHGAEDAGVGAVRPALAFLPPALRVNDMFWQPLVDGCVRALRTSGLPAMRAESGELCPLSELLRRPPAVPPAVLSNATLRALTGVQFAEGDEMSTEAAAAMDALGVASMRLPELIACVRALAAAHQQAPRSALSNMLNDPSWLPQLYAALYALGRESGAEDGLEAAAALLRSLPVFPLEPAGGGDGGDDGDGGDGAGKLTLAACEAGPIFRRAPSHIAPGTPNDWMRRALPRLRVLSTAVANAIDRGPRDAGRLLDALGVRAATAADVVQHIVRDHQALAVCGGGVAGTMAASTDAQRTMLATHLRLLRLHGASLPAEAASIILVPARADHPTSPLRVAAAIEVTVAPLVRALVPNAALSRPVPGLSADGTTNDAADGVASPPLYFDGLPPSPSTAAELQEALRDEAFLIDRLGAKVATGVVLDPRSRWVLECATVAPPPPAPFDTLSRSTGEPPVPAPVPVSQAALLDTLLQAMAEPPLRRYVTDIVSRHAHALSALSYPIAPEGGAAPVAAAVVEEAADACLQRINQCVLASAFAHFGAGLPCIDPLLPAQEDARAAALALLSTLGVSVASDVDGLLRALALQHASHDALPPGQRSRMPPHEASVSVARRLPLLAALGTALMVRSTAAPDGALLAARVRDTLGDATSQLTLQIPSPDGDPTATRYLPMHTLCWHDAGSTAAELAEVLGLPNAAPHYAAARYLLVDVLGVRRRFEYSELCEALDHLSTALMDGEMGDDPQRAFAAVTLLGAPVERMHALCSLVYEELAAAVGRAALSGAPVDADLDAVVADLDADFFDRRRIFVPAQSPGTNDDGGRDQRLAGVDAATSAEVPSRFSTSEDVYWFAATADEEQLAAACGLRAIGPHYPAALKAFFTSVVHVPATPRPSTSRLIEAMIDLANAPSTPETERAVQACAQQLARRDLRTIEAHAADFFGLGVTSVTSEAYCPRHGHGCTHPACAALGGLFGAGRAGAGGIASGGAAAVPGLRALGGVGPDARTCLESAREAISAAVQRSRRCQQRELLARPNAPPFRSGSQACAACDDEQPCDGADLDLQLVGQTAAGIPVYADGEGAADGGYWWAAAEALGAVLLRLASLVSPHVAPSVHLFWASPATPAGEARREVFAFNSGGSLFFSVRAYTSLHAALPSPFEPECTAFWLTTLAHEMAHNLAPEHDARHAKLMERLLEQMIPLLIRQHLQQAAAMLSPQGGMLQAAQGGMRAAPPHFDARRAGGNGRHR